MTSAYFCAVDERIYTGVQKKKIMKSRSYFTGLLLVLIANITACSDGEEMSGSESQQGVAIPSIRATTSIDLSARKGWLFGVGYSNPDCPYYDYEVDGNKLYAFAEAPNLYRFDARRAEGDLLGTSHRLVCYLQDKRYFYSTSSRSMPPERPDILDQSTEEKLLIADRLEAIYTGEVRNHISGINFVHANSLVEFSITGITGMEVFVYSGGFGLPITPLKTDAHSYKTVVLGLPSIGVKVGDKISETEVTDKFKSNTHYIVKSHWDSDSKKIVLDDVREEEWK